MAYSSPYTRGGLNPLSSGGTVELSSGYERESLKPPSDSLGGFFCAWFVLTFEDLDQREPLGDVLDVTVRAMALGEAALITLTPDVSGRLPSAAEVHPGIGELKRHSVTVNLVQYAILGDHYDHGFRLQGMTCLMVLQTRSRSYLRS